MNLKLKYTVAIGAALVGAGFFGGALIAQDHKGHDHAMPGEQSEMDPMMEAFMLAATPGKQHARLNAFTGKWDQTVKFWMDPLDPSQPPQVSQGTYESKWILGGRYLEERAISTIMEMPFEGRAIAGYDNVAGHYFSIWIDTFSTGPAVLTGNFNDEGQLVLEGFGSDPTAPSGKSWMREVITSHGANRVTMEMYAKMDGKIVRTMEIKSKRAH